MFKLKGSATHSSNDKVGSKLQSQNPYQDRKYLLVNLVLKILIHQQVSPVIIDHHNIILYVWLLCRRINIKLVVSLGTPTVYIHHDVYLGPWYSGTIGPYLTEVIRCI